MLEDDPSLLGKTTTMWLSAESNLDLIAKGKMPESAAPEAAASYQRLMAQDQVRVAFNWTFLTGADSTDPTLAGIRGALKGSLIRSEERRVGKECVRTSSSRGSR